MKVTINKAQLIYGINGVIKAAATKTTLSVLTGIQMVAENDHLTFTATDLTVVAKCRVPANVEGVGGVVVPAKLFSELVKKLPDIDIELVLEGEELTINYFLSSASIKTFPFDEFPLPENKETKVITIQGNVLRSAFRQVAFATGDDTDAARQVFTGILFQVEEDKVNLVATDTHRLSIKQIDAITNGVEAKAVVPEKTVNEVFRLVRDDTETVEIGFGDNFVTFSFGDISILTRLVAGNFPDYKRVIPTSTQQQITMKAKELTEAIDRAALLASKDSKFIRFGVEGDAILLTAAGEKGKVKERVSLISRSGATDEELSISFNPQYFTDVLRVLDTDDVIFETSGTLSPALLKPAGDSTYLCIVLPVRTVDDTAQKSAAPVRKTA